MPRQVLFSRAKEGAIVDRSLLEQAGVLADYDTWQGVGGFAGWVAGIGTLAAALGGVVLLFANGRTGSLETEADSFGKRRDAETRQGPVSGWPDRLLKEDGWTDSKGSDEVVVWMSPAAENANAEIPPPTDMLVRREEETLAWVRAQPLGDKYVWPYGPITDHLKDGMADVEIRSVVSRLGLGDFVRSTANYPVEIVGVGLESSHGGDARDATRMLSWDRAILLAHAASQTLTVVDPNKPLRFRGLSLGRALKPEARETADERRQRSALIVTVAFMRYDAANLKLNRELLRSILNLRLQGLNLMGYEYSFEAITRLTDAIAVDGDGDGPLARPKMTAAEALAKRPAVKDGK